MLPEEKEMTHVDCRYLLVSSYVHTLRGCKTKVKRYSKWCDAEKLGSELRREVENCGVCGPDCPGYTKEEKEMTKELFFELLREARRLKNVLEWDWRARRGYLLGMMCAFRNHYEDIRSGHNIQDYWNHQQNGAEGG